MKTDFKEEEGEHDILWQKFDSWKVVFCIIHLDILFSLVGFLKEM